MILSNAEIHKALDEKRLIITPEPSPRIPTIGQECPYDTHSVDLKLHEEIFVPQPGKYTIDLTATGTLTDLTKRNSDKYILSSKQPYLLQPHELVLARTVETISLPVNGESPSLAARIEGKSSRARTGLIVHCTAPTVHPDYNGVLTLEMVNLGPVAISLLPGMPIAQLIIEQVVGVIIKNQSQFQGQTDATGGK